MKARKCDRCGKFYEHYDGTKTFGKSEKSNAAHLIDKDLNEKYWGRKVYDLCPDCMKELEAFLKGGFPIKNDFTISFEPGKVIGNVEINGQSFDAYLGNMESHHCGNTLKRKFVVIEV